MTDRDKSVSGFVTREAITLDATQRRLVEAGFLATAAAVNKASQALGWEAVRLIEQNNSHTLGKVKP